MYWIHMYWIHVYPNTHSWILRSWRSRCRCGCRCVCACVCACVACIGYMNVYLDTHVLTYMNVYLDTHMLTYACVRSIHECVFGYTCIQYIWIQYIWDVDIRMCAINMCPIHMHPTRMCPIHMFPINICTCPTRFHGSPQIFIHGYPPHGGDQTFHIRIWRSIGCPHTSFDWRGLRLHTWKRVWKFGDSRENVLDMYKYWLDTYVVETYGLDTCVWMHMYWAHVDWTHAYGNMRVGYTCVQIHIHVSFMCVACIGYMNVWMNDTYPIHVSNTRIIHGYILDTYDTVYRYTFMYHSFTHSCIQYTQHTHTHTHTHTYIHTCIYSSSQHTKLTNHEWHITHKHTYTPVSADYQHTHSWLIERAAPACHFN